MYETFSKQMAMEADSLYSIANTMILPVSLDYKSKLSQNLEKDMPSHVNLLQNYNEKLVKLIDSIEALNKARKLARLYNEHEHHEQAAFYRNQVADAMKITRSACDDLEEVIDDRLWPLPKYSEMLLLK